jgi:hypothetical protein
MSLFYGLFALFISALLSWLCLFFFFNLSERSRIFLAVVFGQGIFQLANYFYSGYIDPFIVFSVVVSFVFSLIFVVFLEIVFMLFFDRWKIREQTTNEPRTPDRRTDR